MSEISEEEFREGKLSYFRNKTISNIFYRLHLAEMLGTGIKRIKESYKNENVSPKFEVSEHCINIILPFINQSVELTKDQQIIFDMLSKSLPLSSVLITEKSGFGKNKVLGLLKSLEDVNLVTKEGVGRGIKYRKN